MTSQPDPRKVFVVHGRNDDIRRSMFSFLRAIGLQPIEWSQAISMTGSGSPYVGDVLDAALSNAQAIVVVMTPDDEAKLRDEFLGDNEPEHERTLTPQARPNVLFEAGLALGREPKRTVLVEIGTLRPFSDIVGRHVVRLNNSTEKRQDLAERLESAGCSVDISGRDWHNVGDFTIESQFAAPEDWETISYSPVSSPDEVDAGQIEVSDKEVLLLKVLFETEGGGLYLGGVDGLAKRSDMREQWVQYYVDKLVEKLLLGVTRDAIDPPWYYLSSAGRAFLIENSFVE